MEEILWDINYYKSELKDMSVSIEVYRTLELNNEQYDTLTSNFFTKHQDFINSKYLTEGRIIEVISPNKTTLYINSEGFSYLRYVGVQIQ